MANLTIVVATTREEIFLTDVNLDMVTQKELIDSLVQNDVLEPYGDSIKWMMIDKLHHVPIREEDIPLSKLGFVDGDTIIIVAVGLGQ